MVNGEELRRCYSICSSPQEGLLQIGVKAIDQGRFSGFVNRMLKVGDALEVMVPQGRFGYQPQAERHGNYLAIAAGSGITPMLSIIKATLLLEPGSSFTLIYGNRNSRSMMFKEALSDLKNRYPQRFQQLYLFSQESLDSPLLSGRIDRERLTAIGGALLDFRDYDHAFICGPESMMDDAQTVLEQAGVPANHIHSERFNTSGLAARPRSSSDRNATRVAILLDGRRLDIEVGEQDDSILDAALRQGADLPYACKGGVCATCKCRLKAGQVEMGVNYSLEPDQLAAGYVLSCQSWPKGDGVVLTSTSRSRDGHPFILHQQQHRVVTLTLHRPEARNALSTPCLEQLVARLEQADADSGVGAVVIAGAARFFAAGADLRELQQQDLPAALADRRPQLWQRLAQFSKPLLAAVNGYALGAGCELALACDIVIGGESARFGLPEITLGLMPGAGAPSA